MKTTTFLFTFFLLLSTAALAQVRDLKQYTKYMTEGKQKEDSVLYFDAYAKYRNAEYWAGEDLKKRQKASYQMTFCIAKIKKEKEMLDSLLKVAEAMQRKVETVLFDKAVKERNKQWKGFEKYDWKGYDEEEIKKGKEILASIDSLNLSGNALLRIPSEVANCPNLKHVNLLGNNKINWQQSEETLSKLKNLGIYVSVNDLSEINSTYHPLITGIGILKDGLQAIPENILNQKQLRYLNLSGGWDYRNHFSNLSKVFDLTELNHLDLGFCQIDSLPSGIQKLTHLTYLSLTFNDSLKILPTEIGKLTNLTSLELTQNNLSSLPAEIGNLPHLTSLVLSSNSLSSLPAEIGNLTNLTYLDLSGNKLSNLPEEIWKLTNLTSLDLGENDSLKILPAGIGNLTNLTSLVLGGNSLSSLPAEIGNLTNLTSLVLGGNNLSSLPAEIGNLTNLTSLLLIRSQITNINTLKRLENLETLWLWFPISELPIEIAKFKNLKVLFLTQFNELRFSTQNMTEFIKACPKKVQLSETKYRNEDNNILLINVKPIAEEWKSLPNVEVVE